MKFKKSASISVHARWQCEAVDFKPHKKIKRPVSLADIKANKALSNMALIRLGRLSVQPVLEEEWKIVMGMAGEKL